MSKEGTEFCLMWHIMKLINDIYIQHASFYQKLKNERDKTFFEKDKAKQLYDDACAEIESLKSKLNKSSGDHEKIQRQLDAAYIECDNKKVRRKKIYRTMVIKDNNMLIRTFTCQPLLLQMQNDQNISNKIFQHWLM